MHDTERREARPRSGDIIQRRPSACNNSNDLQLLLYYLISPSDCIVYRTIPGASRQRICSICRCAADKNESTRNNRRKSGSPTSNTGAILKPSEFAIWYKIFIMPWTQSCTAQPTNAYRYIRATRMVYSRSMICPALGWVQ